MVAKEPAARREASRPAFHSCELMKPVQDQMAEAVRDIAWSNPRYPFHRRGALVSEGGSGRAR